MNSEPKNTPLTPPKDDGAFSETTTSEIESLRHEQAEQKTRYLLLAADFENFKRRSRQDAEARAVAQKESFIIELLPVIDNLERALASGDSPQFRKGVEMTLQQIRQLLGRHGIEPQKGVGQQFDPHCHEALSQRHDPTQAAHTILEVLQRGYRRGEKVFRHAKVVVNDLTHPTQDHHGR